MKALYTFFLFLAFVCAPAVGLGGQNGHDMNYYIPTASDLSKPKKQSGFTYDDIFALIKKKNISTIEALLTELPTELRSNFTFMYDSKSLQEADYLYPRAILFSDDGSLICTFNGNPKQRGFDSLECSQFRFDERKFEFREIEFPSNRNGFKEVRFSKPNMRVDGKTSCTQCHGNDPRPNWDSYDRWPGAYGSHDDTFMKGYWVKVDPKVEDAIAREKQNFLTFKAGYKNSPRYSQLIFPNDGELAPYSEEQKSGNLAIRPNQHLTFAIAGVTARRNVRLLQALPKPAQYEFLKLGLKCGYSSTYEGVEEKKKFLERYFTPFEWQPHFRNLQNDCEECKLNGKTEAPKYFYETGTGDVDFLTSGLLFHELSKKDREPVTATVDSISDDSGRNKACKWVDKKLKATEADSKDEPIEATKRQISAQ